MARYTKEFVVKANPNAVFGGWLTAMPTMVRLAPDRFKSFRIVENGSRERLTECVERWAGREMTYQTRETLTPPGAAEQVVVSGHGRGSRTSWRFEPSANGTKVRMDLRLKGFEGFVLGVLMRKKFHQEMEESLRLWSRALESTIGATK